MKLLRQGYSYHVGSRPSLNCQRKHKMPRQLPRVHIIGRKNAGKTTLVVELVQTLTARGLRVGTIKHTHHRHEFDAPGKDSFRHRQAGAVVVGLVGPTMAAAFREHSEADRMSAMDQLGPLFSDCDVVLIEGQQQTTAPKVEVWRQATGQPPLALELPGIAAVITDDPLDQAPCPIWRRCEITTLADRVWRLASGGSD